jgi:hypothetical protein
MRHAAEHGASHPSRAGHHLPTAHGHIPSPSPLNRRLAPDEINRLKIAAYRGPIHVVGSPSRVPAAVAELGRETLLGFDTEKRPAFRVGEVYPPALLQLAGRDAVYVFQLRLVGLPPELTAILADPAIVKAGVAIGRDLQELRELTSFEPQGFLDLGVCARNCGLQHHGLRGLAAVLLGCRISKAARFTNWERADLSERALRYAATDAWIGRRICKAMRHHGCIRDISSDASAVAHPPSRA